MILSFDQQFRDKILSGSKKHTIREDKHSRWETGRVIQMATGARTKEYDQFCEAVCVSVQDIEIKYIDNRGAVKIIVDGKELGVWHRFMPQKTIHAHAILMLAINDGFEGVSEFLNWFNRDFKGKIIHWTTLRYG